jgi:hypothetical protein
VAGEPVVVNVSGTLSECLDDPPAVDGVAAHAPVNTDGSTFSVGQPVTVHGVGSDQVFITKRFMVAGSITAPSLGIIGNNLGLTASGGIWYLNTGANNKIIKVVGVQDVNGNDIADPKISTGAGVWVLFNFI